MAERPREDKRKSRSHRQAHRMSMAFTSSKQYLPSISREDSQMHRLLQQDGLPEELKEGTVVLNVILPGRVAKMRFKQSTIIKNIVDTIFAESDEKALKGELFCNRGYFWMDRNRTLSSYFLEDNDQIEIRKKPKKEAKQISVVLPSGDIEMIEYYNASTGRALLLSISNKPLSFNLLSSACFLQRRGPGVAGVWIEPLLPLSHYDIPPGSIAIYGERPERTSQNLSAGQSEAVVTSRGRTTSFNGTDGLPSLSLASLTSDDNTKLPCLSTLGSDNNNNNSNNGSNSSSSNSSRTASEAMVIGGGGGGDVKVRLSRTLPVSDSALRHKRRRSTNSTDLNDMLLHADMDSLAAAAILPLKLDHSAKITVNVLVEDLETTLELLIHKNEKVEELLNQITQKLTASGSTLPPLKERESFALYVPTQKRHLSTSSAVQVAHGDLLIFKRKQSKPRSSIRTKLKASASTFSGNGGALIDRSAHHLAKRMPSKQTFTDITSTTTTTSSGTSFAAPPALVIEKVELPVVLTLIGLLSKQNAHREEGIFRVSANAAKVHQLLACLLGSSQSYSSSSSGSDNHYYNEEATTNILTAAETHELAGALKQYLRKSLEPVVPASAYSLFMDSYNGDSVSLEKISAALHSLDKHTLHILGVVFCYLHKVQESSAVNFMSSDNLGIVFGPTLLRDPSDSIDVGKMSYWSAIVAEIIDFHDKLFNIEELKQMIDSKVADLSKDDEPQTDSASDLTESDLGDDSSPVPTKKAGPTNAINHALTLKDIQLSLSQSDKCESALQSLTSALADKEFHSYLVDSKEKTELLDLLQIVLSVKCKK